MTLDDSSGRRRAASNDIIAARRERSVAAPIATRLASWHQHSASLGGRAHHALMRGANVQHLRAEVEDLLEQVVEGFENWRAGIPEGMAGHVHDAEKSCRTLIATLDELHRRLTSD